MFAVSCLAGCGTSTCIPIRPTQDEVDRMSTETKRQILAHNLSCGIGP